MLYNRNYGILNGQFITYAPKNVEIGTTWYIPAPGDKLEEAGYHEIVNTPYPSDDKYYVGSWEMQDNKIVKVWTEAELPKQPDEDPDDYDDPILDLQEASVDHEYRITLLEIGVE